MNLSDVDNLTQTDSEPSVDNYQPVDIDNEFSELI